MNKNKSKSAYTNKWLNAHKKFWSEKEIDGCKLIIISNKISVPNIVIDRVREINLTRKQKHQSINTFKDDVKLVVKSIEDCGDNIWEC